MHAASGRSSSSRDVEQALLRFTAVGVDALREELLLGTGSSLEKQDALEDVRELTQLLNRTTHFFEHHKAVVAVVKALCRLVATYISAVVADQSEDVAGFLRLDDNVAPILEFLGAFTDQMQRGKEQASRDQVRSMYEQEELLRWAPFVVHACSYLVCGRLPAAESLQSFTEADRILASCQVIAARESRSDLLAQYIEQLVALCSQGISKEEWVEQHSFPKHVLLWITLQVPFPHLGGDLLGRLLALVFPLVDDLSDATQLVGAQILSHVVHNVTSTELRWYSDVLLEVLRVAITSRKPATIDVLLDCLATALEKLSLPSEFAHYDTFFPRLLNDTSLCSDVSIRIIFLRRLRPIITRMGAPNSIHLIRYLQPLLKVLVATFESINIPLIMETLETLRVTILCAWPRIPNHSEEIFVGVMRAVAFCEVFDAGAGQTPGHDEKVSILERCEDIFVLIHDLQASQAQMNTGGRAAQDSVLNMLRDVRTGCAPLVPFCDRVVAKLQATKDL